MWVIFLFLLIIWACAIVTTKLIGDNIEIYPEDNRDQIAAYFGSMGASMQTLFQFMTLDNWRSISSYVSLCDNTEGCQDIDIWHELCWYIFFCFYIILTNFTILSLLTGVVTEAIGRTRIENEDDPNSIENKEKLDKVRVAALKIFSGSATPHANDAHRMKMSRAQWKELFNPENEELVEFFQDLNIDPHSMDDDDINVLFDTFDVEGENEVTWRQFEKAIFRLKGACSAFAAFKMKRVIQDLYKSVPRQLANEASMFQNADVTQLQGVIEKLEVHAFALRDRVSALDQDVHAKYSHHGLHLGVH
jgi:hypothetical protein